MRRIYLISLIFVFLISCKKDNPEITDKLSSEINRYVIDLSGNKIDHYARYLNDVLQRTVYYIDHDTIIEELTENNDDVIIERKLFFIGNIGYAASCIDSVFSDTGLWYINRIDYEYTNGFLTKSTIKFKSYNTIGDSSLYYITYNISDDNIASTSFSAPAYFSSCTDYYDYNSNNNLLDVTRFSNGITGKISRNLISHATWNYGCPAGPSMSVAKSDYEYEFNSDNLISARKEYYTPCYHTTDVKNITRVISITIFEYI
jgi:hypothetical protein